MKVGLYFGSFNPVTYAHLDTAESSLKYVDEVWFIVSPENPLKDKSTLCGENHRLEMVNIMIKNNRRLKSCDIEFSMKRPSYTIDTIHLLEQKYPEYEFYLIIGSDAINTMTRWKNYEELIKYPIIGFIRDGEEIKEKVTITLVSNLHISSTDIRNRLKAGLSCNGLTKPEIIDYIKKNKLY